MSKDEQLPGAPDFPRPGNRPSRRRINLNATVHEDTITRLDELAEKFASHRGQLVDKLVLILWSAYKSGKTVCIHGGQCVAGRTDLPEIY